MVTNSIGVLQRENARLQVENHTLHESLNQMRDFIEILNVLASAEKRITSDAALLPLLRSAFFMALDLINAPEGSLLMLDDDTNELKFLLVKGLLAERLLDYRIPVDEGIAGWVIQNERAALVRDVRHDARFSDHIDEAFKFRTQSIAAVPIVGDGKIFGVLEALNQPADEPFSDQDVTLLNLICRFVGELLINVERSQPAAE